VSRLISPPAYGRRAASLPYGVVHTINRTSNQYLREPGAALRQALKGRHSTKSHASPPHIGQRISLAATAP
jgi:hypothetical protein